MATGQPNPIRLLSSWFGSWSALLPVLAVIAVIEIARTTSVPLPAPFLMLFGGVALAAGLAGVRAGLIAATIAAAYISYSMTVQFGPESLTGNFATVLTGSTVAFVVAYLIGRARDKHVALEAELLRAKDELATACGVTLGQVRQELGAARGRLESAIERSPASILIIDTDRKVVAANPAVLRILELDTLPTPAPVFAELLSRFTPYTSTGERFEFGYGPVAAALETGKVTDDFVMRTVRDDGMTIWFRASFGPIMSEADEKIIGAMVIALDITDAREAAEALKDLSRQLMQVQEAERARLAYELQDEVGQHLTALYLQLHALRQNRDNPALIDECIAQISELTETVRGLSVDLRPAMLDHLGIVASLRWYLDIQRERTAVSIVFDADESLDAMPTDQAVACFRIVQEAVNNAIKHAKCGEIAVKMYNDPGCLKLSVTDDGIGFEVRQRGSRVPPGLRLGLLSMRERASLLGGAISIDSEIGRGTRVTASFPTK